MPLIKVNDINMYYEIHGSGYPLVLIQGLGMDKIGWQWQIETFSKHYKVIIFDNRGIGRTDKPKGPYTTSMMAKDTKLLMDKLGIDKAHILGISMGGMIAQQLAINYKEKVNKLILVVTYAQLVGEVKEILKLGTKQISGTEVVDAAQLSKIDTTNIDIKIVMEFMLNLTLTPQFINEHRKEIEEIFQEILSTNPSVEAFLSQVYATQTHDTVDKLKEITAPTLIITGDKDILVPPKCSDILAENIKGAKLIKLHNAPHALNWENKDEFNRIVLKFLAD